MNSSLISIFDVDNALRRAKNEGEAFILAVNLMRNLFPYETGLGFAYYHGYKALSHSDLPVIDPKTPFIKNVIHYLNKKSLTSEPEVIPSSEISLDWVKQGIEFVMVVPIRRFANKDVLGTLLFASSSGFSKDSIVLANHCAETLALVLGSFMGIKRFPWKKWAKYSVVASIIGVVLTIEVPVSTLGNAQVVAKDPIIITAPMNGVVKNVNVKSNDIVQKGDLLVSFDDTEVRGKQRVAAQTINISASEMVKQERASFFEPSIKNKLEESRAERAVRSMEYRAITSQLGKLSVAAPSSGTIVLDDPIALIGKPVKAGEKLLSIVDPTNIHIEFYVPAHDSNMFSVGDTANVYLDNNPMQHLRGIVSDIAYEPVIASSNILSYKAHIKLDTNQSVPGIGMCGKLKIKGENVSLFWYLFRKPLAYARWYLG